MEAPTKTTYGATTLPLMTGREYMNSSDHIIRYVKEGKSSDMPVSLVSQVGAQIRILRGHYLSSPLAPAAGVRYDGLCVTLPFITRSKARRNTVIDTFFDNTARKGISKQDSIGCVSGSNT